MVSEYFWAHYWLNKLENLQNCRLGRIRNVGIRLGYHEKSSCGFGLRGKIDDSPSALAMGPGNPARPSVGSIPTPGDLCTAWENEGCRMSEGPMPNILYNVQRQSELWEDPTALDGRIEINVLTQSVGTWLGNLARPSVSSIPSQRDKLWV
ncbi:hypothetical protein DFH06DRAFT_1137140 [Mycena polygramma]|nr:hypothetical protein DFH06DRAFT_1137140 [Mycena polygramma]